MKFSSADIINLIALVISMAGTFMMYYSTPDVDSRLILYSKAEQEKIRTRDRRKNKMIRRGMLFLVFGFLLQLIALFVSIAYKKGN